MRKSGFTENEMVRAVKQLESGMEVSQVSHLKELEEENRKLKQMYASLALDNQILKEVIEKNSEARMHKD